MRVMPPIVLALCLTGAAACGSTDASDSKDDPPGAVAPSTSQPSPSAPGDKPKLVKPKPGTVKPRPVKWKKAVAVNRGKSIRITWWSGVEPCSVLDRVAVKAGAKGVKVTLYEGQARGAKNPVCIQMAVAKVTEIDVDKPVGKRRLIDGAKTAKN